jgi:DNA-binding transcriptional ArsR family regulator
MSRAHEQAVADVFFALGDGTRLAVVRRLGVGVPLSATALSDDSQVTRQAIVKHLQVLEGAGLVTHEKRGREVLYALESRRLEEARVFLEGISAGWDRAIGRLRRMVEEPPPRAHGRAGRVERRHRR